MTTYTIDNENSITVHATRAEAEREAEKDGGTQVFSNIGELGELIEVWTSPNKRMVEVYNDLPGVKQVKKFETRKIAARRIFEAIVKTLALPTDQPVAEPKADRKPKAARKAKGKAKEAAKPRVKAAPHTGTKKAKVVDLVSRPGGATVTELMKATGWERNFTQGFVSTTLRGKMGLNIKSEKVEGERIYSLVA